MDIGDIASAYKYALLGLLTEKTQAVFRAEARIDLMDFQFIFYHDESGFRTMTPSIDFSEPVTIKYLDVIASEMDLVFKRHVLQSHQA